MTALHTPAPWACDLDTGDVFHADDDVCPLVATVNMEGTSQEQFEADCRLIAKAPELLRLAAIIANRSAGSVARDVCEANVALFRICLELGALEG